MVLCTIVPCMPVPPRGTEYDCALHDCSPTWYCVRLCPACLFPHVVLSTIVPCMTVPPRDTEYDCALHACSPTLYWVEFCPALHACSLKWFCVRLSPVCLFPHVVLGTTLPCMPVPSSGRVPYELLFARSLCFNNPFCDVLYLTVITFFKKHACHQT